MIIRAIRLFNVGVYAGEHCIEPSVWSDGYRRPITLIGGMNGAGKTTLVNAVLLALYGSQSPFVRAARVSYSAFLESLISRDSPRDVGSWVELELQFPTQHEASLWRVRRSWRVLNVRAVERLEVWRDNSLDPVMTEVWDDRVQQTMPSALAGLFFQNGEEIFALAESDETPTSVQEAVCSMLGVDLVDRLIADLGVVIRRNTAKLRDPELRARFDQIQAEKEYLQLQLARRRQDLARTNTDLARTEELLRRKKEEYMKHGSSLWEHHEKLTREAERLREACVQTRGELLSLASGPLPLLLVLPLLIRLRESLTREEMSRQAQAALPLLVERNTRLLQCLEQTGIPEQVLQAIRRTLDDQLAETQRLSETNRLFPVTSVGMGQLRYFIDTLSGELRALAWSAMTKMHQFESLRENVERQLEAYPDKAVAESTLREITQLTGQLEGLKRQKERLSQEIRSLEHQLRQTDGKLDKLANSLVEAEEAERVIRYASRSQDTMRMFRHRLITDRLERLANEIHASFRLLGHKSSLFSRVSIDPRTLRIMLLNDRNEEIPKSRLSDGEKQVLAVAVLWGLVRVSGRRLPVIVDAPLGRLDSSHRATFLTKYLPNVSHQVIVLSTDTEIVGPHLHLIDSHVGRRYLLVYDDQYRRTRITEGYFAVREEG